LSLLRESRTKFGRSKQAKQSGAMFTIEDGFLQINPARRNLLLGSVVGGFLRVSPARHVETGFLYSPTPGTLAFSLPVPTSALTP
jgi:hypothetical protein